MSVMKSLLYEYIYCREVKSSAIPFIYTFVMIFSLMFIQTSSVYADEDVLVLSLDECIEIALEQNTGFKSANLLALTAEYNYMAARAAFDPMLTASLYNSGTHSSGEESNYLTGIFDIQKNLFTGGQWNMKLTSRRNKVPALYSSGESFENQFDLTYRHPLLEGADRNVVMSGLEVAQIGKTSEFNRMLNVKRELLYQITGTWYDVLKSEKAIEVAKLSLKEAQTLLEQTQATYDVGFISSYEVTASESGLASREEALLLSKASFLNNLDRLKNHMGMPLFSEISIEGDLEADEIAIPDFDEVFNMAKENRPDLAQYNDSVKLAEVDLRISTDSKKASLYAVGQVGLAGQDLSYNDSISNMDENVNWYLGLDYIVPLGKNREAKARFNQAELKLETAKVNLQSALDAIKLEITLAIRNLETAWERIQVTSKGVNLQEEKLSREKARYELGLITSGDLLDYEEDLAIARLNLLEAKADYLKAIAYLEYVTFTGWEK